MQVKKTTIAVVVASLLLLMTMTTLSPSSSSAVRVYAQDNEGAEEVIGTIYAEEEEESETEEEEESDDNETTIEEEDTGPPLGYQDVERAEVIDDNGNVQNPGGADNENISLSAETGAGVGVGTTTAVDDPITTRPTNLAETVLPPTIQSQEYKDIRLTLQAAGYAIADMQYTLEYGTGIPIIIVRGVEDVPAQPNLMDLESIGAAYGYALRTHVFIGDAWETTYESVTGS
jgi:hypothetical protein